MQLASALSMGCCCRKSQHLVPMVRATPCVTHPGDGTGNMEVQTASLGHSKPHAQNSRCKSHGTLSIHLAFSPFSNPLCVFPLSHLCWIFSISPYKVFPHSYPLCSIPRSWTFMDISLAFWLVVGFSQWEAPARDPGVVARVMSRYLFFQLPPHWREILGHKSNGLPSLTAMATVTAFSGS